MRHTDVSTQEFAQFYAESKDRCLRAAVASGIRSSEAEDAVAEAFARALMTWRHVRALKSPSAWVVRTAVNVNISRWRKTRREVVADTLDQEHVDGDGSAPRLDLLEAVRRLPKRQREVVALRYLLDMDTAATAEWLEIAPGTVTAHLHHALVALRSQMTQLEGMHR